MSNLSQASIFGLKYTSILIVLFILAVALTSSGLSIFVLIPMALLTMPTIIPVHLGLTFGTYWIVDNLGYFFPGENGASFFLLMLAPSSILSAQIQGMIIWYMFKRKKL